MPIEVIPDKPFPPADDSVGAAFMAESRQTLHSAHKKIVHCLDQLSEDDLHWRPFPTANSLENIVRHLCGNVRQWIMHGIGGAADVRDRESEFTGETRYSRAQLLKQLEQTIAEADDVLRDFDTERLTESRTVQGFSSNLLSVIYDCVSHFVGHTHQIVYIARLRLGEDYRFQWAPEGIDRARPAD